MLRPIKPAVIAIIAIITILIVKDGDLCYTLGMGRISPPLLCYFHSLSIINRIIPVMSPVRNWTATSIQLTGLFLRLLPLAALSSPPYVMYYVIGLTIYQAILFKKANLYLVFYPPVCQHLVDNFCTWEKHPFGCLTWFSLCIWPHSLPAGVVGLVLVLWLCLVGNAGK